MKWIFVFLALGSVSVAVAQSEKISLPGLAKTRAAYFLDQQAKAKAFAAKYHKLISQVDENGNTIRLFGVMPSGLPQYMTTFNAGAAITTGASLLSPGGGKGLNLQGKGMLVGVWDAGAIKPHIELDQRVIANEGNVPDSHSEHVTGTLIASGINPLAKGMAPLAEASAHDFDNDEAEMAALSTTDQTSLLFSSHSYGTATGWAKNAGVWQWYGDASINPIEDYRFGFYETRTQTIDQIAALAPYHTIVWAAGNDRADVGDGSRPADCNGGSGYDCIIPEGVAKNIITVGAVNKVLSYANPFDVSMSFFSSWGPTDDGRIKPDLVGAGVNLFSLSAAGTDTYTTMSGTSMATPNVTGSLILLQELYSKLHGGKFMRAATLKALAIHTAKEAGNFPGPDYSFGWGLLDVAAGANHLLHEDGQNIMVQELSIKNDQTFSMPLSPRANQKITATIVWTDPPANPSAPAVDAVNLNLVNDLDLRIIDDQGREQLPWILDPSNPSAGAAVGDNFRDNVEKLEFSNPESKPYTLVVRHKSNLATLRQDFSLILSYTSTQLSKTLYWVGDSGDWADGTHWSFASGGAPALQIPGTGDHVIIDESSFDGVGMDTISLSRNETCASLLWINSKPSGLSLNNHTLSITVKGTIATSAFNTPTNGRISFLTATAGSLQVEGADLTNATLSFDQGAWNVNGNFKTDLLELNSGTLIISRCKLSLKSFVTGSTTPKQLQLDNSQIKLSVSSDMDGGSLTIAAQNAALVIDSTQVNLNWRKVEFPGAIIVGKNGTLILEGDNHLGSVEGQGSVQFNGSNQVDTLVMSAGSRLVLGAASVQSLTGQTGLEGDVGTFVTILSPSNASLQFSERSKLCFDYLNVDRVSITGFAVVNAGTHSAVSNASNWLQQDCSTLLYADFKQTDNCAGGLTKFTSLSTGNVVSYSWTFGGAAVQDINPSWKFLSPGNYPVTLEISDGVSSDAVTRSVAILQNTLPENQVLFNGNSLMSFSQAARYQWFKDGVELLGATGRSLSLNGEEGLYFVVTYNDFCNISSDTLTFTGLVDDRGLEVFPNPVSEWMNVKLPAGARGKCVLTDMMGRGYDALNLSSEETLISTHSYPNGIYILMINLADREVRKKIMIQHGSQ